MKDKIILASSALLAIGAFASLLVVSSVGSWRYFVAGGVCAAFSHAIPTPVDVVKTRQQVDPELADEHILNAARIIAKTEGLGVLWSGLGPTVWGYLMEGAVKFGVYEVLKPVIKALLSWLANVSSWGIFNSHFL
eukprot:scaffold1720_cov226-Cylindrotheca_fusiformis.AAC.1